MKHCLSIEEQLHFMQSLHYGSKISAEAKEVMSRLQNTEKLDTHSNSLLQEMEEQITLIQNLELPRENTPAGQVESMESLLAEKRLEWRTLIAKVDTMVNQYTEIPSLLETFSNKFDEVTNWLKKVKVCQEQLELQEDLKTLVEAKSDLSVSHYVNLNLFR